MKVQVSTCTWLVLLVTKFFLPDLMESMKAKSDLLGVYNNLSNWKLAWSGLRSKQTKRKASWQRSKYCKPSTKIMHRNLVLSSLLAHSVDPLGVNSDNSIILAICKLLVMYRFY